MFSPAVQMDPKPNVTLKEERNQFVLCRISAGVDGGTGRTSGFSFKSALLLLKLTVFWIDAKSPQLQGGAKLGDSSVSQLTMTLLTA